MSDTALSDIAGDALYAVAIYAGLVMVFAPLRPWVTGLVAAVWCVAIELFQLTGVPVTWADAWPPLMLVFGSVFDARDLGVYVAAIAVACGTDLLVSARRGGAAVSKA